MKKIIIATMMFLLATPVLASDLYAGVKFGSASYGYTNVTNKSQAGSGIFVGYQIAPNMAIEAEYAKLGGFDTVSRIYKGSSIGVNGVGTLPMNDQFELIGKLGIASTKIEATPQPGWTLGGETSHTTTGLTVGLAAQFNVSSTVGIRASYDSYPIGNSTSGTTTAGLLSIGGVFKF